VPLTSTKEGVKEVAYAIGGKRRALSTNLTVFLPSCPYEKEKKKTLGALASVFLHNSTEHTVDGTEKERRKE
jgi:hypothetical protein